MEKELKRHADNADQEDRRGEIKKTALIRRISVIRVPSTKRNYYDS
jgi:hypothetical protein